MILTLIFGDDRGHRECWITLRNRIDYTLRLWGCPLTGSCARANRFMSYITRDPRLVP